MVYFLLGRLPWQGIKARSHEKDGLILKKKQETPVDTICDGLPEEFAKLICYGKSLDAAQIPDYAMLSSLFRQLAERNNIEYDSIYDWTIRMYSEQAGLRDSA